MRLVSGSFLLRHFVNASVQGLLGEKQRHAPIELLSQMPAQHLFGSSGNQPFGVFGSVTASVSPFPQENKVRTKAPVAGPLALINSSNINAMAANAGFGLAMSVHGLDSDSD